MPFTTLNDKGEEVTVYTKEELDNEIATKTKELQDTIADKDKHLEDKNRDIQNLRFQNKKYSELTEEQKGKLTEAERIILQNQEEIQNSLLKSKQEKISGMIDKIAGNDAKLKEKITQHYATLDKYPESSDAEIASRLKYAANNALVDLGHSGPSNPVMQVISSLGGGSPASAGNDNGGEKSFAETERGQAFDKLLFGNLPVDNDANK